MSEMTTMERTLGERVAEELRVLLARRRSSATDLAKQLGWTQSYMARRMSGAQPFDLNDIERIASALGVRPLDLFTAAAAESTTLREASPSFRAQSRPPNRIDATGPDRSMSGPRRASRLTRPSSRVA